ncbi:MAG TPA: BtrH N-terminal domain-containing protein [Anaeromyxobacteraceae bacterium]|nr:BtrH N-terminal domain-containing protein [Anaeromyxobacteraceae bacterium]
MILPAFEHRPGVHCGSTALADALRARGLDLSEPMAFGLGAGLGFFYVASPALSPSHLFQGRSAHLERTACEVLGAPVRERTEDDPARAWDGVKGALARGIAPILATDLAELPYWRSRTPFGGHRVVLAGHDEGRGIALVADTDRPGLEEVSLEALGRARASLAPPFGQPGHPWLEVDAPARPRPLGEAIRDALRRQSRDMLLEVDGIAGVSALERFAGELSGWPGAARDEEDRAWCFRYAFQVIEKRGTGGGLFRRMYALFLGEAEEAVPALAGLGLRRAMEEIAAGWSRLAAAFRAAAGEPGAGLPAPALELAHELARRERRFHEDLAARVP